MHSIVSALSVLSFTIVLSGCTSEATDVGSAEGATHEEERKDEKLVVPDVCNAIFQTRHSDKDPSVSANSLLQRYNKTLGGREPMLNAKFTRVCKMDPPTRVRKVGDIGATACVVKGDYGADKDQQVIAFLIEETVDGKGVFGVGLYENSTVDISYKDGVEVSSYDGDDNKNVIASFKDEKVVLGYKKAANNYERTNLSLDCTKP